MARITLSPLLVDIRGKVADAVFSKWKGINYVRARVTPSNPQTPAQTVQREALADCLTDWQSIKAWAKKVWDLYARGYDASGYNFYMDNNIEHVRDDNAIVGTPEDPAYSMISTAVAVGGASGQIDITWTDLGGGANDKVFMLYRLQSTPGWTRGADVLASAEVDAITGLTPAADYVVCTVPYETVDDAHQASTNQIVAAGA